MGADGRLAASVDAPGLEDSAQLAEHAGQVSRFVLQERPDVHAGRGPGPSEPDDAFDFGEGQTEPARLADERQEAEHVGRIQAVA